MTATFAENARGALYMTASMAAFIVNDTLMALALAEMGLFQAMLLRGIVATALLAALVARTGALARLPASRDALRIAFRSGGEIGSTITYLLSLGAVGLTMTTSIFQATPLAVTLAAALFLGEKVGWRRGLAVAIGFCGVMLIVRPGLDGFRPEALFALGAVCFVVFRDLMTRGLSAAVPSSLVTLATSVAITAVAAVGTLFTDWQPVEPHHALWLAAAALFLAAGYHFSVTTMRIGEISFISPFRYTALVWAILLGIVILGEVPDTLTLAGSLIVVATGLFTFWRERQIAARGR